MCGCSGFYDFTTTCNMREEGFTWADNVRGLQFMTERKPWWQQLLPCLYWLEADIQDSEAYTTSKTYDHRQSSSIKTTLPKKILAKHHHQAGTKYSTYETVEDFPRSYLNTIFSLYCGKSLVYLYIWLLVCYIFMLTYNSGCKVWPVHACHMYSQCLAVLLSQRSGCWLSPLTSESWDSRWTIIRSGLFVYLGKGCFYDSLPDLELTM